MEEVGASDAAPAAAKPSSGKRGARTRKQLARKAAKIERAMAVSSKSIAKAGNLAKKARKKRAGKALWTKDEASG